jgi:hypothetical protein
VEIPRTSGIDDPTREQVLGSELLTERLAYMWDGERVDTADFTGAIRGSLRLCGLGIVFATRGRPAIDPSWKPERERSKLGERLHEAGLETRGHLLLDMFGSVPLMIVRGLFGTVRDKRRAREEEKIGAEMLEHPSSFFVPWTALVAAEVGDPVDAAPPGQLKPVDPVVLTEERDGERRTRALCVDRFPYSKPAVDAEELFRFRASFEQLALAIEILEQSRSEALDSKAVRLLCRRWFGRYLAKQSEKLLAEVWAPLGEEQVRRRASSLLAPFPIAAALDPQPEAAGGHERPSAKPATRPFGTSVWRASLVDARDLV